MKLLIDSQVLIWLLYSPEKIGKHARYIIDDSTGIYMSAVTPWELAIKFGKKKLPYSPADLIIGARGLGLQRLPVEDTHILQLQTIQTPHNDPFDRMLLAQAKAEDCTLLTSDKELLATNYPVLTVSK